MLNIFYGRESIDKEKFIYDDIRRKSGPVLVIVPDQYTLEAEKQAFRLLKTDGLMDVEVLSMSRLGFLLFKEQGMGRDKTFIDRYGRHMLLAKIAGEKNEELQVFKNIIKRTSFIELVNDFISEIKQYDISPEDLRAMAENLAEDSLLRKKLSDMYVIFKEYESRVSGKYTDSEDYIDLYKSGIRNSRQIRGSSVWVYGFDSFAPKAMDVLGELMEFSREVNVFLTYDRDCRDEDLFRLSAIVMKKLEEQAKKHGVSCRRYKAGDEYLIRDKARGISVLEKELYAVDKGRSEDHTGITLVEAANAYNEAESAAAFILHLLRDEGLRFRDIAVICNDQETRGSVISRTFEEYGIGLFYDIKRSILSSPVAIVVVTFIEIIAGKYRTGDIFKLLKTGFLDFTSEETEKLENYAIKYRIKGGMWKKPFIKGRLEYGDDGLEEINRIREKITAILFELETICKNSHKIEDFIEKYYDFIMEKTDLEEKIPELVRIQQEQGLMDLAQETAQTWNLIVGLFDQISELSGQENFKAGPFLELLSAGLSKLEVGVLPPTADDILMGTMERTRCGNIKAMLVLGANEGIIPAEAADEGLFSIDELEFLADEGTEICKVDRVRAMEEKLAIYRNLVKAGDHLWVSYTVNDADGNTERPSEIVRSLREIFPGLPVKKDVINSSDETEKIGGRVNTLRHLTYELQKVKKGEKIDGAWKTVFDWYEKNDRDDLDRIKKGLHFNNEQKSLGEDTVSSLFRKGERKDLFLSPSQIEKFSRCPFSHFVAYGLRPDERRIFEASNREIGDVYHECLMKLARRLTDESRWETVTDEELRGMIEDILRGEMKFYREGVFSYSPEEEYKMTRLKNTCFYVCGAMIEQVRAGRIKKSMYEVPFGKNRRIPPIETSLGDKKISIEGKIDRVDLLQDDRVKVIDYKTGNEKFDLIEAKAGYRLQLMLYLKAAQEKERKPAGVFYFLIDDPQFDITGTAPEKISEKISKEMRKFFRLNGIIVNNADVIKNIAGDFEGFSDIVPLRKSKDKIAGNSAEILLTEEEFAELQKAVDEQIHKLCGELAGGVISIRPKKSGDMSPCDYCGFRGICRFDMRYSGCGYETIK